MESRIRQVLSVLVMAFLVSCSLLISAGTQAWAQPDCLIEIRKRALGVAGGRLAFEFEVSSDGNSESLILRPGDNGLVGAASGGVITVVELAQEGWRLDNVFCDRNGVRVTEIENGVVLTCGQGEAVCTFTNVSLDSIPTLSEWGMIAAAAGFALIGMFYALRRRKAAA